MNSTTQVQLDQLNIYGNASAWVVYSVSSVSADKFNLSEKMAMMVTASVQFDVDVQMPVAGTYLTSSDPMFNTSGVQRQTTTISGDLSATFAVVSEGNAMIDNTTFSIDSMDLLLNASTKLVFIGNNIPNIQTDGNYTTISYTNYDMMLEANANLVYNVVFDQGVQVLKFPLYVGEQWTSDTNATMTGSISGTINASGLTDNMSKDILDSGIANETGATGFPIDLGNLTIPNGNITNGKFTTVKEPIDSTFDVVGLVNRSVQGYGSRNVYMISGR